MAGLTLATAETQLAAYLAAETAVLSNQSYEIAGRRLTRANLGEIQRGIDLWNQRVQALTASAAGRGRARSVAPGF